MGFMADTDTRPALRARLKSIDVELMEVARMAEQLRQLKHTLEAALIQEEALQAKRVSAGITVQPQLELEAEIEVVSSSSIAELVTGALKSGPKTLEELKQITDWYFDSDEKSPGRAINFALVGLQKGGHVQRLENGAWQLSGNARK
jgi:hypothetical protein